MKGRSCLARLDHPSSLSHRIGKRKAAEAIYLLSHRGGGGGGEREEKEKKGEKTINIKILSIHSNTHGCFFFQLIISAQISAISFPSVLTPRIKRNRNVK
ncbi:hypothetical protein GOODEAATRI_019589 [Goodea atripinnis]|uniref:Uncharacterized protein n=1 Tax=Goodea atripinnis TaxID=208336 RepID=A0ABV0P691_9TELE